jgi:hypothetical protein
MSCGNRFRGWGTGRNYSVVSGEIKSMRDAVSGGTRRAATTNCRVVAAERTGHHRRIENLAPLLRGADRRSATITTSFRSALRFDPAILTLKPGLGRLLPVVCRKKAALAKN